MQHLHPLFEEQLQASVNSDGSVLIGGTAFTPAAILGSDRTAYDEEFEAWLYQQWLPEREERLDSILDFHGNRKRFVNLCSAAKKAQIAPFIGSGMSVPTGLLTWSNFLRSIRKHSKLSESDLEELLISFAFEEAANRLAETMPARLFNERVEHDLCIEDADSIAGAVRYLPLLFPTLVLTTNLDNVLETLYASKDHIFNHILAGTNIPRYRALRAETESFLLKLHGDCRSQEGRVLGCAEYEHAYATDGILCQELGLIFMTRSLLFLGCSLGSDRTVGLIAKVAAQDAAMPKHYAFLKGSTDDDVRIDKEHFLTERGIYPIWYAGDHDECVEALLVGIARSLGQL